MYHVADFRTIKGPWEKKKTLQKTTGRTTITSFFETRSPLPALAFSALALPVTTAFLAAGCNSSTVPPPTISTTSLPDGTIGTAYAQTIQATGGAAPFTWTVLSGVLPDQLSLASSSGSSVTISGTPDKVQSAVAFTIQVSDAKGRSKSQPYTLNIAGTPTVAQTQSGAVRGIVAGNLIAFRGIPYAAPPVGALRWRPPQPPASWAGVRDASTFGNVCPQINYNGQLAGNEDCLTLNVFVSQNPPSTKMPVMVFFHGGGNARGDAQSPPFDTPPLANQGVVVVTAEYRVGILGFLAHPLLTAEAGGASGHYALLDMITVLSWVQQNIAVFGGDPAHVLLFGQSAGSYDIQMLLVAPSAQGLYSAAGMESGSIPAGQLPSFATVEAASAPFVQSFACDTAADVLACLRAIPADSIVNYATQFSLGPGVGSTFLPADPFVVLQQNGSPVPLLIGSTREESTGWGDDPNLAIDATGYATAIHNLFDPIGPTVATQVLALYPAAAYDTPAYALIAVDSDYNMTCEVRNVARTATGTNRQPVWRYLYIHRFENDASLNADRAFHTAELYFVFGNLQSVNPPNLGVNYTPTPAELDFSALLMGYWTRFAATGNPNGGTAAAWPPYDATSDAMLQLDDTSISINGYHNSQCDYLSTLPQP